MTSTTIKINSKLYLKALNRQIFNPTVIKHRKFDCHIATAKHCGTHWIKYMISLVLCEIYDLPPPNHIIEDNIVGHTKTPPRYNHIPQIAVTHSHPHYCLRSSNIHKLLNLPKFLILVRDPRDILVSAYEKAKGNYLDDIMESKTPVDFSQFIRANMQIKKPFADIWSIILFFNAWGALQNKPRNQYKFMAYETIKNAPEETLKDICDFIGIPNVTDQIITNAVQNSSRKKMKKKLNPNEPQADKSVNLKVRNFKDWYNEEDREFCNNIFDQHLKFYFGYNLADWN